MTSAPNRNGSRNLAYLAAVLLGGTLLGFGYPRGAGAAQRNVVVLPLTGGYVVLPIDCDGDGLLDRQERSVYGTDPHLADTDGDGVEDGAEVALWGAAWNADPDGDGLINLLDPDADGDGINDGVEVAAGSDPGNPASLPADDDQDGDGVITLFDTCPGTPAGEVADANGCSVSQPTDSDGDGVSNYIEAKLGTSPTDATDVPTVRLEYGYNARGGVETAAATADREQP